MTETPFQSPSIGILGGGQLGRMLIQEAINLNIRVSVLDPDPDAPCSKIADDFQVGSFKDYNTVIEFGRKVDLLTIEIEHVNVDALEALEKQGRLVRPSSKIIRMVQDKGAQKIFYRTNGIPTSAFHLVDDKSGAMQQEDFLPFMQKMRTGGYDGRGVTAIRNKSDFEKAFDAPSVLEKMVDFDCEIAVIVARNPAGDVAAYPLVEMEFNAEANLVELLFAPAAVNDKIKTQATEIAINIANAIKLEGILAVEMFVTKDGEVLVNEIAPRPHNSGHATIEGNVTSQFEQHLRAVLNLPLGSTDMVSPNAMVNILGEKNSDGEAVYHGMNECLSMGGVHIHLYGKKYTKPFRKMGHATICKTDLKETINLAREVARTLIVKSI